MPTTLPVAKYPRLIWLNLWRIICIGNSVVLGEILKAVHLCDVRKEEGENGVNEPFKNTDTLNTYALLNSYPLRCSNALSASSGRGNSTKQNLISRELILSADKYAKLNFTTLLNYSSDT